MDAAVYRRMADIDREHWWFVARRKILTALIERFAPKQRPLRILEVGCGTGSNIAMLQAFGQVDAVEPDTFARAFASDRTGVPVKGGYLPDVPLTDGLYDLIVLLDVLEHIPGDRAALEALRPKLAPGGRLMVTVPANPWMWSAHDVAHHHQRRYTGGALRQVFRDAGYRVRRSSHFNSVLFPLIAGARLAGKLRGKEGGDDAMPPQPLNRALAALFGAERYIVPRVPIPFGVSLALVAEPATTR